MAVLLLITLPLAIQPPLAWIPGGCALLLILAQIPMTARLVWRLRDIRYLAFAVMSLARSFWRGIGMVHAMMGLV